MTLEYVGYSFIDGKVTEHFLQRDKDKYFFAVWIRMDYKTSENFIRWGSSVKLDRKTLDLYFIEQRPPQYRCEVYNSITEFEDRLDSAINELQNIYDEKTKKNKI